MQEAKGGGRRRRREGSELEWMGKWRKRRGVRGRSRREWKGGIV